MTIKITPAAKKYASEHDMYVEYDTIERTDENGETYDMPVVSISEESSDFLVCYAINDDGTLSLEIHPEYVYNLPARIETSIELRNTIKNVVDLCVAIN